MKFVPNLLTLSSPLHPLASVFNLGFSFKSKWLIFTISVLIVTKKTKRPMGIHGSNMKNFSKDLHVKDDLILLDNKLCVPATIRGTFSTMLQETHPGQFGMKSLAEYIWWPHVYPEIYHHGKSCSQCLSAGKNLNVLLGTDNITKLPTLNFANEEIILDFAGPLDAFWGTQKKTYSFVLTDSLNFHRPRL